MKKITAWMLAVLSVLCLAGCSLTDMFGMLVLGGGSRELTLSVSVPAHQTGTFYTEEELSPFHSEVELLLTGGAGETMLSLVPDGQAEKKETYAESGMPVTLTAEKGQWYRLSLEVKKASDTEREFQVRVKGAEVRIE